MLELLLGACGGEEEVRGVVAECLGHTALLAPGPVLAVLRARLSDPSPAVRAVIAASPRGMVVRFGSMDHHCSFPMQSAVRAAVAAPPCGRVVHCLGPFLASLLVLDFASAGGPCLHHTGHGLLTGQLQLAVTGVCALASADVASAEFRTLVVKSANQSIHLLSPVPVSSRQVDRLHPIDELLQPAVPELLQGLTDPDRCSAFGPIISIGV